MNLNRILWVVLLSLLPVSCSAPPSTPEKSGVDGATASLPRSNVKPLYNLEKVGDVVNPLEKQPVVVPASGDLNLSGWAVDGANREAAGGVDVVLDGKPYRAEAGQDRIDVAEHFHVPAYAKAGFTFSIPQSLLSAGKHELAIRVISRDGKSYSQGAGVRIEVR